MIDGLGKKICRAPADRFERSLKGVLGGHENEMDAGIATERAGEEFVGFLRFKMDAGENQAATPESNEAECLFGITGANRFIAHIGDERVERIALGGIVVENARRQGAADGGDFNGFVGGVGHAYDRGNKCAKGNERCFEWAKVGWGLSYFR